MVVYFSGPAHSRCSRRSFASFPPAAAKTRAAVFAPDRNGAGERRLPWQAILTMMIAGVSSASPSSIVTVSTAVMAPLVSSVILNMGSHFLTVGSQAQPVFRYWSGHLHIGV